MLLCLSVNHINAGFDLLEKISGSALDAADALMRSGGPAQGVVVLATCNRFEAYLDLEPSDSAPTRATTEIVELLSAASGVAPGRLRQSTSVLTGPTVVEHLFAVSAGLESVVVGEDEISGQVHRALERARSKRTTSPQLERLFQKASHTARDIKSGTAIGGAGRSLVRLALELASSRITDWSKTPALIVGTGQYAATTLAALRHYGAEDLRVFSPSGRGAKFALRHDIALEEDLTAALAGAQVVITCTASTAPVITPATLSPLGRTRLVIDLGLPRNVDPSVADIQGLELLDLETVSLHAPIEELNATSLAREMVDAAAAEFQAVSAEQTLTSGIVALRSHVFGLLEAEIARVRAHGGSAQTEAALRHLVGVLLHTPSVRARELARSGDQQAFTEGLEALFGIQTPDAGSDATPAAWPGEAAAS